MLREDKENKVIEVGVPVGVVAGLIPSNNHFNSYVQSAYRIKVETVLSSLHPMLQNLCETVDIITKRAAAGWNCPERCVSVIQRVSIEATMS